MPRSGASDPSGRPLHFSKLRLHVVEGSADAELHSVRETETALSVPRTGEVQKEVVARDQLVLVVEILQVLHLAHRESPLWTGSPRNTHARCVLLACQSFSTSWPTWNLSTPRGPVKLPHVIQNHGL